jgi:hypothetical protein
MTERRCASTSLPENVLTFGVERPYAVNMSNIHPRDQAAQIARQAEYNARVERSRTKTYQFQPGDCGKRTEEFDLALVFDEVERKYYPRRTPSLPDAGPGPTV